MRGTHARRNGRAVGVVVVAVAAVASILVACTSADDSSSAATDAGEVGVVHDGGRDARIDAALLDVGTVPTATCSPTALPPDGGTCDPDAGCTEFTIYNFANPGSMATLAGTAYFTGQSGAVGSCVLPDCAHIDLLHYDGTKAYGIAATPAGLFWNESGQDIWSSDLTGNGAHVVATDEAGIYPRSAAAAGRTYYWALSTGSIHACDVSDCTTTDHQVVSAADASGLLSLATDGTSLFWTDDQRIARSDLDGANVTTILPSAAATAIAVDGCGIYWAAGPTVMTCKTTDCAGTVSVLATITDDMSPGWISLGADGTNVYLIDRDLQRNYVIPEP